MSWFSFLCKGKTKDKVNGLDPNQPAQGILVLLKLFDDKAFKQYTIRKAMQHQIETYSEDIDQLMTWIDWMYVVVDGRDYAPVKWKSVKSIIGPKILDDYLSSEGHDVSPEVFIKTYGKRLETMCLYLTTQDKEEEYRKNYYKRQYRPILHDVFNLLTVLHRVIH